MNSLNRDLLLHENDRLEEAAQKIVRARKERGWTQTEAAQKLGTALKVTYSLRQYQKLEAGEFTLRKQVIIAA